MKASIKSALLIGGTVLAAGLAFAYAEGSSDLTTVPSVDLNRYVGQWYEIARYPNRFQKQCAGDVTATYTAIGDSKIEVLNSCRNKDGRNEIAKGKARVADPNSKARLRVTFFWPFYGDYWIIGLDPEYRWAVVGEPSRKYLWILSRSPQMDESDYRRAVSIVREKGYDPSKLVLTPQR
jgi:apolipoprotein D and lipocalin family protein